MSAPSILVTIALEEAPRGVIIALHAPDACRAGAWAASQREQAHEALDAAINAAQNECESWPSGACSCRPRAAAA
jgi:hypothetical protein